MKKTTLLNVTIGALILCAGPVRAETTAPDDSGTEPEPGYLRLEMPELATENLLALRLVNRRDSSLFRRIERPGPDTLVPVPPGEYNILLTFDAPQWQLDRQAFYGFVTIEGAATNHLVMGAIRFDVAPSFREKPTGLSVIEQNEESVLLPKTSLRDKSYLFKPIPAPAGTYKVAIEYALSRLPVVVARDIVVEAARVTPCPLDTGVRVKAPSLQGITGWDLVPQGTRGRPLIVRQSHSAGESLWDNLFLVIPGTYSLHLRKSDQAEPVQTRKDIAITAGGIYDLSIESPFGE